MNRHQFIHASWVFFLSTSLATISLVDSARGQDTQLKAQADVVKQRAVDADGATSPVAEKGTEVSDEASRSAREASQAARAEKLERRAGEQVTEGSPGKSIVLGMSLQEILAGRVKVVEVGATSPAFDAGVREGDEILSYHGFSADSYRKWIDGMRRLTTDAPDGSTIPVVVLREGKRMALRIRVPEARADDVRMRVGGTLGQRVAEQQQPGFPVPTGPSGVPPGGGNDVNIGNAGPFGDFFGGQTSDTTEHAIAHIVRVGNPPQTAASSGNPFPAGSPAPTPTGAQPGASSAAQTGTPGGVTPPDQGTRIGMAGFRNDATGMLVMVDVGGLPPGNYLVGINDPGVVGGQTAGGNLPVPNVANRPEAGAPAPPATNNPGRQQQIVPLQNTPNGPAERARPGVSQPQSKVQQLPATVLRQVVDSGQSVGSASSGAAGAADASPDSTIPATGQAGPTTVPPTGQTRELTTPATGQVNPSTSTPTGQSEVNNALPDQINQSNAASLGAGGATTPTLNEIGTLTVDESGTGRMQQVVEGVQVRDVVGQAIVIYSQNVPPQTTLPPNLDPAADPSSQQAPRDPRATRAPQQVVPQGATSARTQGAAVGQPPGSNMPVAAGIIRLISDRRPSTTNGDPTGGLPAPDRRINQPPNDIPATGQNPIQ